MLSALEAAPLDIGPLPQDHELLQALPTAIYITDAAGRLTFFNEAAAKLWGWRPELRSTQWSGFRRMFSPDGTPLSRDQYPLFRAVKEQRPISGEQAIGERADGSRIAVLCFPRPLHNAAGKVVGAINTLVDVTSLKTAAEEALRESEERLRAVFNSSAVGVAVLTPQAHFIESNDAFTDITGYSGEELRLLDSASLTHPDDRASMQTHIDELLAGMRSCFVIEKRYRRKDGSIIWVQNSVSLTHDDCGRPLHLVKLVQNITERKNAEKRQRLLVDELNHRVKNTLATVQSFAVQTLRNAPTIAEGRKAFEARLIALSKTHDVLTRQHWEGADVREMVEQAIAVHRAPGPSRFRVSGPGLMLQPKAALALSLALHELATNAVKYGALSTPAGMVEIEWQVTQDRKRFRLRWAESGGPKVTPPQRRGFGSRLVERGLAQDIGGDVRLDFTPDGVMCSVDAPLHEVASAA